MITLADIELQEKDVLAFTCGYEVHLIAFSKIIRLEADGSYTRMFTVGSVYTFSRHIGFIEEKYFKERAEFLRARDSAIINLSHVSSYANGICIMTDGSAIQVARRRKAELKQTLIA